MFASDKDIILTIVASAFLMIFLIVIIVIAVVRYQNRMRLHLQEISNMKIAFQDEILKIQNEIEEQTFQRISEEIHDNIGQILSLAKVNLHTLRIESDHPALKKITIINDLVGKAIQDLRQLSKSLNTGYLSNQTLSECIRAELDLIRKTGVYTANIVERGEEQALDVRKQLILFRMVQEILNNIMKHAKANAIDLLIEFKPEAIFIHIKDNGVGFDMNAYHKKNAGEKGSGIGNIFRRAHLLEATVNYNSVPDLGTQIQLKVPY
jgi:two-component system, NarL family, sensor kinase